MSADTSSASVKLHSEQGPLRDPDKGWRRFLVQIQKDFKFFLLTLAGLQLVRVILIALHLHQMDPASTWRDVLATLLNGVRFDVQAGALFVLPSLVLSTLCLRSKCSRAAERLRLTMAVAFVVLTVLIGAIDLIYFHEFHAQFDHFAFGAIFDDVGAVLVTVWKEHHVAPMFLGGLFLIVGLVWSARCWLAKPWYTPGEPTDHVPAPSVFKFAARLGMVALLFLSTACALRGSITLRPMQQKDAAITRDALLNKTVVNPYAALRYALLDYQRMNGGDGLRAYLPDGDIRAAALMVAPPEQSVDTIDDALRRVAPGPAGAPPRHIFLIVMESYDGWAAYPKYSAWHLTDRLQGFGERGILVRSFLPASSGTMTSLSAIMTGLGDAGVFTNYQPTTKQPLATSIAPIFHELGYKTRFFYGGYLSWQRCGDFAREQGFDEVYGGGHMGTWSETNEWGIPDEELYRFIDRTVADDAPSFNMVMTTSNHPPYSIDIYGRGFPLRAPPPGFEEDFAQSNETLVKLGHFWYSDQVMGEFIDRAESRLPRALFAVTGDHWSREFIGPRPTIVESSAVPMLFYGPQIIDDRLRAAVGPADRLAGSHHDLAPTLVELAAPKGFVYHALGSNMLRPGRDQVGFGRNRLITPRVVVDVRDGGRAEWIDGTSGSVPDAQWRQFLPRHNAAYGVSWWRLMRGIDLPGEAAHAE